jgi:23S rRNA pseudouridine1911/1915/1917 synthase
VSAPERYAVPPELAGQRLDVALARLAPGLTRARAQRLVEGGHVRVDGRAAAKPAARLRGGEALEVEAPAPEPSGLVAQDLPLNVLLEDDDLLVLDKAAGMVVHPARGSPHSTVVNALLFMLGGHAGPPERSSTRLGLVHRLDKETSGCLVVAKTEAALAALQAQWKARSVEKVYLALCHGALAAEGRLDTPYGRHPTDRTRYTTRLRAGPRDARRAVTEWRVRERFGEDASLAEVTLHTGRTHQIRVHLAEHGHPLVADAVYGGTRREARLDPDHPLRRAAAAVGRQALHAWRLGFDHPRTGRRVRVEAPVPPDLAAALAVLRAPTPSPARTTGSRRR